MRNPTHLIILHVELFERVVNKAQPSQAVPRTPIAGVWVTLRRGDRSDQGPPLLAKAQGAPSRFSATVSATGQIPACPTVACRDDGAACGDRSWDAVNRGLVLHWARIRPLGAQLTSLVLADLVLAGSKASLK